VIDGRCVGYCFLERDADSVETFLDASEVEVALGLDTGFRGVTGTASTWGGVSFPGGGGGTAAESPVTEDAMVAFPRRRERETVRTARRRSMVSDGGARPAKRAGNEDETLSARGSARKVLPWETPDHIFTF
jgi:hypothetical protein